MYDSDIDYEAGSLTDPIPHNPMNYAPTPVGPAVVYGAENDILPPASGENSIFEFTKRNMNIMVIVGIAFAALLIGGMIAATSARRKEEERQKARGAWDNE